MPAVAHSVDEPPNTTESQSPATGGKPLPSCSATGLGDVARQSASVPASAARRTPVPIPTDRRARLEAVLIQDMAVASDSTERTPQPPGSINVSIIPGSGMATVGNVSPLSAVTGPPASRQRTHIRADGLRYHRTQLGNRWTLISQRFPPPQPCGSASPGVVITSFPPSRQGAFGLDHGAGQGQAHATVVAPSCD